MNWKPRASSLGYYFSCDFRAAFDRAVAEGLLPAAEDEPKPYADLGTLIHWQLMNDMGLKFPNGKEPPTPDMVTSAATLYRGNESALMDNVASVAALAKGHVPPPPKDAEWWAETHYEGPDHTGTIDFIASDGSVIGDLKTTSRKPTHNKVKAPHLYQILAYKVLAELNGADVERGWILYAGSRADWALCVEFKLNTPEIRALTKYLKSYATYLRGPELFTRAVPRLGTHCEDEFCPHRHRCRDKVLPKAGDLDDAVAPVSTTTVPEAFT